MWFCFRQSKKFGAETDPNPEGRNVSKTAIKRSGCAYGSGFSSTALMTLKSAAFAPIPNANARIATVGETGAFQESAKGETEDLAAWSSVYLRRIDNAKVSEWLFPTHLFRWPESE